MATYDYTQQPEFRGPARAVTFDSSGLRWPEELGPQSATGMPRIGAIPPLLPPAQRDAENAERERRNLLRQRVKDAALAAAASAMEASTLTAQLFADVDEAVEKAVSTPPGQAAGSQPERPRRPHRRTAPLPDASEETGISVSANEPEPASPPEEATS